MNEPEAKIRRLDALAQDIAPARDLWTGIAARLESTTQPRSRVPTPRLVDAAWLPWAMAAGVAFAVSGAWWLQREGIFGGNPELAALEVGDPALAIERRRLAAELPAMLDALPVDARFGAQQSLTAVRAARSRIVAALKRDANDPALREWLIDNQQEEVRVMQSIASAGLQTRTL